MSQQSGGGSLIPLPKELRERARELYQSGTPLAEVAAILNIKQPTIRAWSSRYDWKQERLLTLTSSSFEVPDTLPERVEIFQRNMQAAAVKLSHEVAGMKPEALLSKSSRIKDLDIVSRRALGLDAPKPGFNAVIQLAVLASGEPNRMRVGEHAD